MRIFFTEQKFDPFNAEGPPSFYFKWMRRWKYRHKIKINNRIKRFTSYFWGYKKTYYFRRRRKKKFQKKRLYIKRRYYAPNTPRPHFLLKAPRRRWSYTFANRSERNSINKAFVAPRLGKKLSLNLFGFRKKKYTTLGFFRFLKRKRARFFFKMKWQLNIALARLFQFRSYENIKRFKKYLKNKRRKLYYFNHYFFSRLDYNALALAQPSVLKNEEDAEDLWSLKKAQLLILTGFVLVNYKMRKNCLYKVQSNDCITFVINNFNIFGRFWGSHRHVMALRPGALKYHNAIPRLRPEKFFKTAKFTRRYLVEKLIYYKFKLPVISKFFSKHYKYFYEYSREVDSFIYLTSSKYKALSKFIMFFSPRFFIRQRRINYFINMSFI